MGVHTKFADMLTFFNATSFSGVLLFLTLLSGLILASAPTVANDSVVDVFTVTVEPSCTFKNQTGGTYTRTLQNGQYTNDVGSTTITVLCNDSNGYSVYAIGYSGDTEGNTNMLGQNNNTIPTGLATSGDTSSWAMKLTAVSSGDTPIIQRDAEGPFSNFHTIPSASQKVVAYNSAIASLDGASFTTTYAVYVSLLQPAGTYIGKVKYTLIHPNDPSTDDPPYTPDCPISKICYLPNASGVPDTVGNQTASSNTETQLWPSNFKRTGYGFAGWNTEYDGSGTSYGPNETITTGDLSTKGLNLFAYWVPQSGVMQTWNSCSNLAKGDIIALLDNRDNEVYAVAKLADDNCWMIENLRLTDSATLNSTNTNNPAITSLTNSTSWCTTSDAACINQSQINKINLTSPVTEVTAATDQRVYSYGVYYNWYSATAGRGTYEQTSGNATGDICPYGWQLPTGDNTNKSFAYLDVALGGTGGQQDTLAASNRWRSYPNNFVFSGNFSGTSNSALGKQMFILSSTAASNTNANRLWINGNTNISPDSGTTSKNGGRSVRCLKK